MKDLFNFPCRFRYSLFSSGFSDTLWTSVINPSPGNIIGVKTIAGIIIGKITIPPTPAIKPPPSTAIVNGTTFLKNLLYYQIADTCHIPRN